MTQKIVIDDASDHAFTVEEFRAIQTLALEFPQHDIRINSETTNLKVYVGPYYQESHRYWIKPDGRLGNCLVEQDHAADTEEESDWYQTDWFTAYNELSK